MTFPAYLLDPDRYEHGTRARYNAKCRCADCRAANTAYERARSKREPNPLVSAAPARAHLRQLSSLGVGTRSVADAAKVSRTTLRDIRVGDKLHVAKQTEQRILAVDLSCAADAALVEASETWRLLKELIAEGYTKQRIARALGSEAAMPALQFRTDKVLAKTAWRVKRLHAELTAEAADAEVAPADDSTRARILRALRWFDWVLSEDLCIALDIEAGRRSAIGQALLRMWRRGEVQRRAQGGEFEYAAVARG